MILRNLESLHNTPSKQPESRRARNLRHELNDILPRVLNHGRESTANRASETRGHLLCHTKTRQEDKDASKIEASWPLSCCNISYGADRRTARKLDTKKNPTLVFFFSRVWRRGYPPFISQPQSDNHLRRLACLFPLADLPVRKVSVLRSGCLVPAPETSPTSARVASWSLGYDRIGNEGTCCNEIC